MNCEEWLLTPCCKDCGVWGSDGSCDCDVEVEE